MGHVWIPTSGYIVYLVVPVSAGHFHAKYLAIVFCFLSKFAPRIGVLEAWKTIMTELVELFTSGVHKSAAFPDGERCV